MKRILYTTTFLIASATGVYAADLGEPTVIEAPPIETVAPAPSGNWAGFYAGAQAGYGWANSEYHFATDGDYNLAPGDKTNNHPNGWLGGVQLGYNWQKGAAVFGVEASALASSVNKQIVGPYGSMDRISNDVDWVAAITPRVGVAADDWLVYGKGGVAFARQTARLDDVNFGLYDERSKTTTGWTLGAGVEKMVSSNVSVGVEGNYFAFGKVGGGQINSLTTATNAPSAFVSNHSVDTSMFNAVARINFKFGD